MSLRCSVLPGMSHWLNRMIGCDDDAADLASFKQMCGLLADIVSTLFTLNKDPSGDDQLISLYRLLVLLCVQCAVQQGSESLVRIGNSCLRYSLIAIQVVRQHAKHK